MGTQRSEEMNLETPTPVSASPKCEKCGGDLVISFYKYGRKARCTGCKEVLTMVRFAKDAKGRVLRNKPE